MKHGLRSNIVYGQVCLYLGLLIAAIIRPKGLTTNDGISYYGTFQNTVVPYALGLLGSAYFSFRAARQILNPKLLPLRAILTLIAPLTVIIILTPYSGGQLLDWIHTTTGAIIFILQLILSGWLIKTLNFDRWVVGFSLLELAAGIACAIYVLPSTGWLIQGQVIFQIAFAAVLIRSSPRLHTSAEPELAHLPASG